LGFLAVRVVKSGLSEKPTAPEPSNDAHPAA